MHGIISHSPPPPPKTILPLCESSGLKTAKTISCSEKTNMSELNRSKSKNIILFYGKSSYLSNFSFSFFVLDGQSYTSVEQCYQYKKALFFKDMYTAKKILGTSSAYHHKRFGKKVVGFKKREWKRVSEWIMKKALLAKFRQNAVLRRLLLSDKTAILAEASPNDRF